MPTTDAARRRPTARRGRRRRTLRFDPDAVNVR